MKIDSEKFRVHPDAKIKLDKIPTKIDPLYKSEKKYRAHLQEQVSALSDQQELLYGSDQYALLLIFQGMDAAGKDGAIRHVMSGINPQGCDVES
jgi:polyphosphate kinase 2 (PPK2 family)